MDGYQFQKFVASLFQKLGFTNVKVGPTGADEGVDLDMEQKTDVGTIRYVVECKHHSEGTVGRPVVQKLHSVVMTKGMHKGIIVTSGNFSGDAATYAESVGIELIDMNKLKELAKKIGMSIKRESSISIENCFPISDGSIILRELCSFLGTDLKGFKDSFLGIQEMQIELLSSYMIDYNIDATFSTSAGVIHSVNEKSVIFLHGESGECLRSEITNPFISLGHSLSEVDEAKLKNAVLVRKGDFKIDLKEIKEKARDTLRRLYAKTVSYYGANNVRYSKKCVPNKKDITILEARRVYLPIWRLAFSILGKRYVVSTTETSGRLNVLPCNMTQFPPSSGLTVYPDICLICSKELKSEAYLCNECGAVICGKDKAECKVCGKIVCTHHTISKRKLLVLSDKYCLQCAKSQGIS
jgi:restriction system protein